MEYQSEKEEEEEEEDKKERRKRRRMKGRRRYSGSLPLPPFLHPKEINYVRRDRETVRQATCSHLC